MLAMYAIVPNDIWIKPAILTCCKKEHIPTQLAKYNDAFVIYEVGFSPNSYIIYENDSIHADNCTLENPSTIHSFLTKNELWVDALQHSGLSIQYYRGEKPEDLCIEAVKQNGLALQYIETPYQTEEICLYAVHNNWESLQYVKNQTGEVCRTAIAKSGKAIQYVLAPTAELCCSALENGGGIDCIQAFPLDVCLMAVQKNAAFLQYIPTEKQTHEVCAAAIEKNPHVLQWVHNQTNELCLLAVKKNGLTLQHVRIQTAELCMAALGNTAFALSYVKEYMLGKLCPYALDHNIDAIHFTKVEPLQNVWWNGFVYGITASVGLSLLVHKILLK